MLAANEEKKIHTEKKHQTMCGIDMNFTYGIQHLVENNNNGCSLWDSMKLSENKSFSVCVQTNTTAHKLNRIKIKLRLSQSALKVFFSSLVPLLKDDCSENEDVKWCKDIT